ncbi:MAG TPA: FecR family protein, partial [Candidatus Limnocylindria bacterium]|nr:FecR family protein [Candidatus Limnocylindria bacterium]
MGEGRGLKPLGRYRYVALAIAVVLVVGVGLVAAQRPASASSTVLTILNGQTEVARAGAGFAPANDGDIVSAGDRVRTAEASHAVITFFDGSTIELEPSTTIQIDEAAVTGSGARSISLLQTLGRTWSSVQKLTRADSKYELKTPSSTAVVRGTGFETNVSESGQTTLTVTDGSVAVTAQGQTVNVTDNQTTTVPPNAPPSTPSPAPPPQNTVRFGMHSPAFLAVSDPLGRTCGAVLPGPIIVRQIPGCVASTNSVFVPNPRAGQYTTIVFPDGAGGAYTIDATGAANGVGVFNVTASGSIAAGEVQSSGVTLSFAPDGSVIGSPFGPIRVVQTAPLKVVVPSAAPTATAPPSPLPTPGPTFITTPTPTIAATPTAAATATPSPTPSPTPSETPAPTPVVTIAPTPVPTAVPTEEPTPTPAPTTAPTLAPSPSPSPSPTVAPLPTPVVTPSPTAATPTPTPTVTATPTPSVTATP